MLSFMVCKLLSLNIHNITYLSAKIKEVFFGMCIFALKEIVNL